MIARLRAARLSRLQLVAMTAVSALATAVVISAGTGRTAAQSAALAALHSRRVVVENSGSGASGGGGSGSAAPAPSAASPASPAPASAPASQPSASGGGGSGTSDGSSSSGSGAGTDSSSSPQSGSSDTSSSGPKPTKVKHVFVIALTTPSFDAAFGPDSVATYLNHDLRPKGTLLSDYKTLGGAELPDYLAMVSGQAPNSDTAGNCSTYAEFPSTAKPAANGQVPGTGCIYPNTILTIGDQVTASGHRWGAYIEAMGQNCVHPNSGAVDDAPLPGAGADYDTRHNPFIYFHSLLDLGDCASDDLDLGKLAGDLQVRRKTPTYSFIAPGTCEDAAETGCADGAPGGLVAEDAFLKQWVPQILSSPAYRKNGALLIVFAHAAAGPVTGGQPVRTGALLLSRYARRGKTVAGSYNPYSVLRSVEQLLGQKLLVHAQHAKSFVAAALPGV